MQQTNPTIVIIGAKGRMGRWFSTFFEKKGFQVLALGKETDNIFQKNVSQGDIVLISVPISQTQKVLETVIPFMRPDALICDITSVKELPLETMKNASCGTLGMHPLFGPSVIATKGLQIVFCHQKNNQWVSFLEELFTQEGIEIIKMFAKEHDRQMAFIQALTHSINILLAQTLNDENKQLDNRLQTPIFKLQTLTMQRVLQQDPKLMSDIQLYNKHFIKILTKLNKNTEQLLLHNTNKDKESLISSFERVHESDPNKVAFSLHQSNKVLNILKEADISITPRINPKSTKLQNIAFLGPLGTNTHNAALKLFPNHTDLKACKNIEDVFELVRDGKVEGGVIPAENSLHGTVRETFDLLADMLLISIGSIDMPIHHALLSLEEDFKNIRSIVSHPQALAQCKTFIKANLPHAELITAKSTTSALSEPNKNQAYIASKEAGELYHVPVLRESIEDAKNNVTRFYVIAKSDFNLPQLHQNNTLLFLTIINRVGILRDILDVFANNNISLNKLESRPSSEKVWDYCFYIEVDQSEKSKTLQKALRELQPLCISIRCLGRT